MNKNTLLLRNIVSHKAKLEAGLKGLDSCSIQVLVAAANKTLESRKMAEDQAKALAEERKKIAHNLLDGFDDLTGLPDMDDSIRTLIGG